MAEYPMYAAMPLFPFPPKCVKRSRPFFIATPGECWVWQGSLWKGYGRAVFRGKLFYIHRMLMGTAPSGMEVDHLCRNPTCCNPSHLEWVTHWENCRRGREVRVIPTHCKKGHEYTPENTTMCVQKDPTRNPVRRCRKCQNLRYAASLEPARRRAVRIGMRQNTDPTI